MVSISEYGWDQGSDEQQTYSTKFKDAESLISFACEGATYETANSANKNKTRGHNPISWYRPTRQP
jgi:hypothetical protein